MPDGRSSQFDEGRTVVGFLRRTANKIVQLWRFYIGPAFLLPLIAFPWILRDRRMRLALVAGFIFCLGWRCETWTFPHYVAPAPWRLVYLVLVQCMRHLRLWRRNEGAVGPVLGPQRAGIVCVGMIVLRLAGIVAHAPLSSPIGRCGNMDTCAGRAAQRDSRSATCDCEVRARSTTWIAIGFATLPISIAHELCGRGTWGQGAESGTVALLPAIATRGGVRLMNPRQNDA